MTRRRVSYTTRNLDGIINRLAPKRLSEPEVVYLSNSGRDK